MKEENSNLSRELAEIMSELADNAFNFSTKYTTQVAKMLWIQMVIISTVVFIWLLFITIFLYANN